MPEGRAANQPFSVVTLMPPNDCAVAGRGGQRRLTGSPASSFIASCSGESAFSRFFLRDGRGRVDPLVERHAEFVGEAIEQLAGVLAGSRGDLGGEQARE